MNPSEKDLLVAQLTALAEAKLQEAKFQKMHSGRISAEVVAETYRILCQIKATLQDKQLDMNNPDYLFGLYTALLQLHRRNEREEKILHGRATDDTIRHIARFQYMLEQLRGKTQQPGSQQETAGQPRLASIENGLVTLFQ